MKQAFSLAELGRIPALDERMETLFSWLASRELVQLGGSMDVPAVDLDDPQLIDGTQVAIAQPTSRHRTKRRTPPEMKAIKDQYSGKVPQGVTNIAVWQAEKDPATAVRSLNWAKLPADAMAFYRPFHFPPFDQWGIYLLVGPLLEYHKRLRTLAGRLNLYSNEILMHLVLFEVFNHEFFHHLAESAATFLEILAAARGDVEATYLSYHQDVRERYFPDPHAPLEEALANAYAHNALSFISRIKTGYKTAVVKSYQEALKLHWQYEPPGYQHAGYYIDGAYVPGGAHLLAQMVGDPEAVDQAPLSCLAKHLMPNGFTALAQKPDIPTYLVGSEADVKQFNLLVPAPNEAYTQLFWPYNTTAIDHYVQQKKAEEKAKKKRKSSSGAAKAQLSLFGDAPSA
ncbi:MAG: hypothetical protein MUC77_16450 [Chromatiaceae bacterium]|jgi:hypothetical protein|nr:hypothetical protein [Chromatiaceae bacterium]